MPEPAPSRTVTVKVSGALLDEPDLEALADCLDRLPAGRQALVVHGGGPQLDEALAKAEDPVRFHRGLRVTTRAQAGIVQATLDAVGARLASGLAHRGVPAEHVDSLQRRLVAKPKRLDDGVELGRVGTPVGFHVDTLPEPPTVPVLTPVGTDGTGPLNVNADEAAAALAGATGSRSLVFATSAPGVLDESDRPLSTIDADQARRLVEQGVASGGMQPKLEAALEALAAGVDHVRVGPLEEGLVLEAGRGSPGEAPGTEIASRPGGLA